MFLNKLSDADAEAAETQVWLDFSKDCGYLSREQHAVMVERYLHIGGMLGKMMANPERFKPLTAPSPKQRD
jgi:four helix bundle protein